MRQKCDYIIQNTKMNPKRTQDPDEEKCTMYYLIKYANEYKNAMLFFVCARTEIPNNAEMFTPKYTLRARSFSHG